MGLKQILAGVMGFVLSQLSWASQLSVDHSLKLEDLVARSNLIVRATCAFPDRRCKSLDGKQFQFKGVKILKGELARRKDTLDVITWEEDMLHSFKIAQQGAVKKSLLLQGYKPSVEWKDALRKPVLIFLQVFGSWELHFVAPYAYESAGAEKRVRDLLKSSAAH